MIEVKFKKNHKEYSKGDTASFTNNEAFGLIELGVASTYTTSYQSKIVLPQISKRYKTKGR